AASDPGGTRASQFRAAGRGSGRLHAQGRGRRLAPPAGALQGRSRGVEPIDAGRPRRTTLNSTSQGIRIPHHKENVMAIELYVFPPSPRAFKVLAVANHLGLDYELRFLDLPKGAHKTPQYAALNPNVRMPTLKDGDYALWESNAIGQYLAGKKPDAGLLPRDERARLDVTRWQFWDLAHWDPTCAVFAFEYVAKPLFRGIKEPDMAAIEKSHGAVPSRRRGAQWSTQGQAIRDRRRADAGGFLARPAHELCRDGALPDRALRRDQTLVRDAARAAGVAEDARAIRPARGPCGLRATWRVRRFKSRAPPRACLFVLEA